MYNNSYIPNYNPNVMQQNLNDKIDNEIAKLQQMKNHNVSQPAINQTFQLAPNSNGIKFVNDIEDVQKEFAISETPFFNKDYSKLWIKNAKGEIRIFELNEIIPKDEKDLLIDKLQSQINILNNQIKEMNNNEQYYAQSNDESRDEYESKQLAESIKSSKSSNVSSNRTSKSKSK